MSSGDSGNNWADREDIRIADMLKVENSFRQMPAAGEVPDILETKPVWVALGLCGVAATVVAMPVGFLGILYVVGLTQTVS